MQVVLKYLVIYQPDKVFFMKLDFRLLATLYGCLYPGWGRGIWGGGGLQSVSACVCEREKE